MEKALLDFCTEIQKEHESKIGITPTCAWTFVRSSKAGFAKQSRLREACYGRLAGRTEEHEAVAIVDWPLAYIAAEMKKVGEESYLSQKPWTIPWIDYILNRSPFRRSFITKDPMLAIRGGAIKDTRITPAQEWVGGGILLRNTWESPNIPICWHALTQEWTDNENLALILAHKLYLQPKTRQFSWQPTQGGHTLMDAGWTGSISKNIEADNIKNWTYWYEHDGTHQHCSTLSEGGIYSNLGLPWIEPEEYGHTYINYRANLYGTPAWKKYLSNKNAMDKKRNSFWSELPGRKPKKGETAWGREVFCPGFGDMKQFIKAAEEGIRNGCGVTVES